MSIRFSKVVGAVVVFLMISVAFSSMNVVAPHTVQPWVVTGNESYENITVLQRNYISVESGGFLNMTNCTIEFSDPNGRGLSFTVQSGGHLKLTNCTVIGYYNLNYGQTYFTFAVYGRLDAYESTFRYLAGSGPIGGIQLYSNDVNMSGCVIKETETSGIYIDRVSPVLAGNLVMNTTYGYYLNGKRPADTLSTFSDGRNLETFVYTGPATYSNVALMVSRRTIVDDARLTITGSYLSPVASSVSPFTNMLNPKAIAESQGLLYVVSATSGVGKVTILDPLGNIVGGPFSAPTNGNPGNLAAPVDIAAQAGPSENDYKQFIYVLDSSRTEGVHIDVFCMNAPGTWWQVKTSLSKPKALDADGLRLYVADTTTKLVIYDYIGTFIKAVTTNLASPSGISVTSDRIYVLDLLNKVYHIDVFDLSGVWLSQISGNLVTPVSIDVSDKIYVADSAKGVVIFNLDGSYFGTVNPAGLTLAKGIASGYAGRLYVLDNLVHVDVYNCGFPLNPQIDIGGDGDVEWQWSGEFSGSVVLDRSNSRIADELRSLITIQGWGQLQVPIRVSSDRAGSIVLSNLAIVTTVPTIMVGDMAFNNDCGFFFNDPSSVYATDLLTLANGRGLQFEYSSPKIVNSTLEPNTNYDLYIGNGSHPEFPGSKYENGKVYVGDPKDSDGDSLSDAAEIYIYLTDPSKSDTDGDSFSDGMEVNCGADPLDPYDTGKDLDNDLLGSLLEAALGTSDSNPDCDSDGLMDGVEYHFLKSNPLSRDTDSDGLDDFTEYTWGTNLLSPDSDNDGVNDSQEWCWNVDSDGDSMINALDPDSDNDGLLDGAEIRMGTNSTVADTDGDGLDDGAENALWESLGPGLALVDSDGDGLVNILDNDSDNDGVVDGNENRLWGTADSDGDKIPNLLDADSDNDGIPDGTELLRGMNAVSKDSDGDGLSDHDEVFVYFTDPTVQDTDGDKLNDSEEVAYWSSVGLDPATVDSDGDGIRNIVDIDSDNDTIPDGYELETGEDPLTPRAPPTAPQYLVAQAAGSRTAQLAWTPPSYDGGARVKQYWVYRDTVHNGGILIACLPATNLSYLDTSLTDGVTYYYRVTAVNGAGESPKSNEATVTPLCVPSAPVALTAAEGDSNILLSWQPPLVNGGSPISKYRISRGTAAGSEQPYKECTTTSYNDSGLSNGIRYYYKISAVNQNGIEGYASSVSGVPTAYPFDCNFANGYVLDWTLTGTGGFVGIDANSGYPAGPSLKISKNGIPGTSSALHNVLTSRPDCLIAMMNLKINSTAPGQTCYLSVLSLEGTCARIRFQEGAVWVYSKLGTTWTLTNATYAAGVWFKVTVVLQGYGNVQYLYVNDMLNTQYYSYTDAPTFSGILLEAGSSGGSESVTMWADTIHVYLPRAPSVPRNLQATPGTGKITLQWLAPTDNGGYPPGDGSWYFSAPLWYLIEKRVEGATDVWQFYPTETTWTDVSVIAGKKYFYKVSAWNNYAWGSQTPEVSAVPLQPTVPTKPASISCYSSQSKIFLSWGLPASDGGSDILSYSIWRCLRTANQEKNYSWVPSGGRSFIDTNVKVGTTYYYKVLAVNRVGSGPLSDEANCTVVSTLQAPTSVVGPGESIDQAAQSPVFVEPKAPSVLSSTPLTEAINYPTSYPASQAAESPQVVSQVALAQGVSGGGAGILADLGQMKGYADWDNDSDGLMNGDEGTDADHDGIVYPTSPFCNDTDHDGMSDYTESWYWYTVGSSPMADPDHDGKPNIIDPDSDNDGILDGKEFEYFNLIKKDRPTEAVGPGEDFDRDGIPNILDRDSDNDSVPDGDELFQVGGDALDKLFIMEYANYGASSWMVNVKIPLAKDGSVVPLSGGSMKVSGVQSGGGLYGDRTTYYVPAVNVTDVDGADFNGDGTIDIFACSENGQVVILENVANRTFRWLTNLNVGGNLSGICTGYFDSDTLPDIAVCNIKNNTVTILFNDAYGAFSDRRCFGVGAAPCSLAAYENRIYCANSGTTTVSIITVYSRTSFYTDSYSVGGDYGAVYLSHPVDVCPTVLNSAGTFASLTASPYANAWGWADIDEHTDGPMYDLWFNPAQMAPNSIAAADFNLDGTKDLVFADRSHSKIGYIYQYGVGGFGGNYYYIPGVSCYRLGIDDVNKDGTPDILAPDASSSPSIRCYFRYNADDAGHTAGFWPGKVFGTAPDPRSIFVGDVTGDGYNDVVLGNHETIGGISVHPNGMYPTDPAIFMGLDQVGGKVWSYEGAFNTTVTINNIYDRVLEYLDTHWGCTDASDGKLDGFITVSMDFVCHAPGSIRVQSNDLGGLYYTLDPFNPDCDNDGLKDGQELYTYKTDPKVNDTDHDGMKDGAELQYWTSHGVDVFANPDKDSFDNLLIDADSDNDGLYDGEEVNRGLLPLDPDSDHDGLIDFYDMSPLSVGGSDQFVWYSEYKPGMLRTEAEIDTLYYPQGVAKILDNHYDFWTGKFLGETVAHEYLNDPSKLYLRQAYYSDVRQEIVNSFPDYNIVSLTTKDQGHDTYEYASRSYGGDYWRNKEYYFCYYEHMRTDKVVMTPKNPGTLPDGQKYALATTSVRLGVPQSLIFQIKINSGDLTGFTDSNRFVLPAISFSLYRSSDFLDTSNVAYYADTAMGIALGNGCYQFELRIPAEVATDANTTLVDGKYALTFDIRPQWITRAWDGLTKSPMDPSKFTICAVAQNMPHDSYALYARQSVSIRNMSAALPTDVLSRGTNTYYWGDFKIYLYNKKSGGAFDQNRVLDPSYDGIVLVGDSFDSVLGLKDQISWGSQEDGWITEIDKGYGLDDCWTDYVDYATELFDITAESANHWYQRLPMQWNVIYDDVGHVKDFTSLSVTQKGNGISNYYMSHTTVTWNEDQVDPILKTTKKRYRVYDETLDSLDGSTFRTNKYATIGLEAAGLGAVLATDGIGAYLAYKDGNYVRGTTYVMQGASDTYFAVDELKGAFNLKPGKALWEPKYGAPAAIASGVIEIGYNVFQLSQTDDPILKSHYIEASFAASIDMGISMTPYGGVIMGAWAVTIGVFSWAIPNKLAQQICSSPGSGVVFLVTYWFTNNFPSQIVLDAFDYARSRLVQISKDRNSWDDPTMVILAHHG